jgi:hypothetical protein
MVISCRRARSWSLHNKAYGKQLITPGAPRDHPGSPWFTSAAPDGGERRRPMLTRQNRKGNIEASSPKFCPPPHPPSSAVTGCGLQGRTASVPVISPHKSLTLSRQRRKTVGDKIPMGRESEVHKLVGAFLFLASDAASYTTGCDIVVNGGYCLP